MSVFLSIYVYVIIAVSVPPSRYVSWKLVLVKAKFKYRSCCSWKQSFELWCYKYGVISKSVCFPFVLYSFCHTRRNRNAWRKPVLESVQEYDRNPHRHFILCSVKPKVDYGALATVRRKLKTLNSEFSARTC